MSTLRSLMTGTMIVMIAGCSALGSHDGASKGQPALAAPLNALAEQGDVEAMRLVADIEVLRAQGVFSDSAANALGGTAASQFFKADKKGKLRRAEVGEDISTLFDYSQAEPLLLKQKAISDADATELRRLANYNTAAAADMAEQFKGRASEAKH